MDNIFIALITIIFVIILMNVILNKRLAILSSILFVIMSLFFCIKYFDTEYYQTITKGYENIDQYIIYIGIGICLISLMEFIIGCKKQKKPNIPQTKNQVITIKEDPNELNSLLVFLELFSEPLCCYYEGKYIINTQMMKILKVNNFAIARNEFYSYINKDDLTSINNKNYNTFRINNDNESIWFEEKIFTINNHEFRLVNKMRSIQETKVNLHSFKQLCKMLENNVNYYLVNINITNLTNINAFYGKDFGDIIINSFLQTINNVDYFDETKLFFVDKSKYILLINDKTEYEILLSELDNNDCPLINQVIKIANNNIAVKAKLGIVASKDIDSSSPKKVIEEAFNIVSLAMQDDYPGDYAIYTKEEKIEKPFEELDIDLLNIRSNIR